MAYLIKLPLEEKIRIIGDDGLPVWANIPALTVDKLQKQAERKNRYY
ncbi:hypothetical protein [Xenorhabdus bovienii]|nr:hypothetical protein [Xenorhabdus bovienii]MDE9466954.1 hypothetical protein [Xenorhabdus bovienii]MDE9487684.1 hypothetical protein [Xenorhabdus bovienii]MDE9540684.1 hypothetical protein [Xenorhabdus bovienii]